VVKDLESEDVFVEVTVNWGNMRNTLVDSGATWSIVRFGAIPGCFREQIRPWLSGPLGGANGSEMWPVGVLDLDVGFRHSLVRLEQVVVFEDAPHGLLLGRDWLAVDGVVGYRQGVWGVFLGEEFVPSDCQLLAEMASEVDFEEGDSPLWIDDSWLEEIGSETEEEILGLADVFAEPEEKRDREAGFGCLAEGSVAAAPIEGKGPTEEWPDLIQVGGSLVESQREALWTVLGKHAHLFAVSTEELKETCVNVEHSIDTDDHRPIRT
jgi:hypothetical protein